MKPPPRLPLARLAAEFLVIVTGVLVALGAQAWYEGREEIEREIAALHAIRADLIRTEQEVGRRLITQRRVTQAVRETGRILSGERERPEEWTPDVGLSFQPLRLPLGSLEALISSGDARLVSSDGLRGDLIAYYDEQRGLERWAAEFDAGLIDRIGRFIDALETLLIESDIGPIPDVSGPPLEFIPMARLRRSEEIRGFISYQSVFGFGRVGIFSSAIQNATAMRASIEEEFTSRGIPFDPAPEMPSLNSEPESGPPSPLP